MLYLHLYSLLLRPTCLKVYVWNFSASGFITGDELTVNAKPAPNKLTETQLRMGRLKTQVRKTKVPGDGICKYGIRKYECTRVESASTKKTQVRICNGGKRKYSNLKSILKSLRYSTLAFSVDPLSVGLDQFTCTVPDRCYTQEIGLMLDSCAKGPGFINRRRDAVE